MTPFIWEHHIPEATYQEFAEQDWPAKDAETITVEPDPFGLDRPAPKEAEEDKPAQEPQRVPGSAAIRDRIDKYTRRTQ